MSEFLAALAGVLVGGLGTFFTVWWGARQAEQAHQRERNQERRADLYVDFLVFMSEVEEGVDPYDHPGAPRLSARMTAFGSDDVKRLLRDYWHAPILDERTRARARQLIEEQMAAEMQNVG